MLTPSFLLPQNLPMVACNSSFSVDTLLIEASSTQSGSACPACGWISQRKHSMYLRRLVDLPSSGYNVKVIIQSGKYFCDNPDCFRKIFTERFSDQIIPHQRRFERCRQLLVNLALELGGNKGSAISHLIHLPVSSSSILRIVKRQSLIIPVITSGIIGIDDWAFKKGNRYGTIIVDLQLKKVVDLLPDREAETVALWLSSHPEVRVISRDRGGPYCKGAQDGAPEAIQVADRFHLLMNLGDAIKRMFQGMGKDLKTLFTLHKHIEEQTEPVIISTVPADVSELPDMEEGLQNSNLALQVRFSRVKELLAKGFTIRAISRSLDMSRVTIRKYLKTDYLPRKTGWRSTNFDSFRSLLLQESSSKLYTEMFTAIAQQGFNGGYSQFCNNMNELLNNHNVTPILKKADPPSITAWSAKALAIMMQKEIETLKAEEQRFLNLLYEKHPTVKETKDLTSQFKELFQIKAPGTLRTWLEEVEKSSSGLKQFAKNIKSDYEAINNAVITPYSNGQVEGQVNRLKNIKRRMYGRAGFELLRKMVIFKSG